MRAAWKNGQKVNDGPLLQPVADRLAQAMAKLPLQPPTMPYVSNRGAGPLYDAEATR